MSEQKSNYNKEHKKYARELRNQSTLGESLLWQNIQDRKVHGFLFNRQYCIGDYIVDFICRKARLIIEIDGYSHYFKYEKDIERENYLKSLGYTILRFEEREVKHDIDNVLLKIEHFVSNCGKFKIQSP
jgi:very-short-patch-repair endonuclease